MGCTNDFLINKCDDLAVRYNDRVSCVYVGLGHKQVPAALARMREDAVQPAVRTHFLAAVFATLPTFKLLINRFTKHTPAGAAGEPPPGGGFHAAQAERL